MATITLNSGSTPPVATFVQDLSNLVEILKRGGYPANILTPGVIDQLSSLANASTSPTSIVITY